MRNVYKERLLGSWNLHTWIVMLLMYLTKFIFKFNHARKTWPLSVLCLCHTFSILFKQLNTCVYKQNTPCKRYFGNSHALKPSLLTLLIKETYVWSTRVVYYFICKEKFLFTVLYLLDFHVFIYLLRGWFLRIWWMDLFKWHSL